MEEDLPKLLEKFTLTEDEELELEIPGEKFQELASRGKACIVGKLLTDRLVSKEIVKESLSRWWKLVGGLSFKVLGDNLFLIDFTSNEDKERVLAGTPWVFEGSLFLIEDFDGTFTPSEFTFDHAAFWVRIENLPLACMGREIGQMIGASVGVVEAIDTDGDGIGWGESLRVKILLVLTKPLPRGRKIKIQGAVRWISFQYECLPKRFCYNCGVIIHGKADCTRRSSFRQQEQEYGPWLRAASPTRLPDRNQGRNVPRGQSSQGNARRGDHEKNWERGYQQSDDPHVADPNGEEGRGAGTEFSRENVNPRSQTSKGRGEFQDIRATKKGKWDEEARKLSLHDSPGHVGSRTVPGLVEQFFMGPCGIISSPVNSQTFQGPIFSEIEKTMQGKRGGKKKDKGVIVSDTVSWKRKLGDAIDAEDFSKNNNSPKHKRDVHGDLKPRGDIQSGKTTTCLEVTQNGSGMAEAIEQPRRPQ
ncbi:uncharacterized protein LOC132169129 [Corylus avellana]|uniref:uncharacterized protein LOC132169129 n=1 Tax=Corylus avellana TaxID=13451 RepID=UPI00286B8F96|nr:uncharacterized protein LOC132169129 [Corylus avellana]